MKHLCATRSRLKLLLAARSSRCPRSIDSHDDEAGFTLVELLIVIVILPIVVGALAAGLIAVFSMDTTTENRVADSGDAQVVSANYVPDIQSAQRITTDPNAAECGTGTQLLGLEWGYQAATNSYRDVVTYSEVQSGPSYLLVRDYCSDGPSAAPSGSTTVSFDIAQHQSPPTITPDGTAIAASAGWVSTETVTGVMFPITEPLSNYTYTLTATPATASRPNTAGSPINNDTGTRCGFATTDNNTVQNGTYAQTLCLVDFSTYDAAFGTSPSCQEMVASIPGNFTLSFCVSVSGTGGVSASALPTWPGAFLGNVIGGAPFYTGIGCPSGTPATTSTGGPTPSCIKPALYMANNGGYSEIQIKNISLTTATGAPATGWEAVTADAETTDPGEYIMWTSNKDLTLIPNTPSSEEGDACNKPASSFSSEPGPGGTLLTGIGTETVECESTWQSSGAAPRTGTVMLGAAQPTSMTIYMQGAGLEGVAFGLLLS